MGETPWQKVEVLVDAIKQNPDLEQVFERGTPAEKVGVLLNQGFTLQDIHQLLTGLEAMSAEGMASKSIWIW